MADFYFTGVTLRSTDASGAWNYQLKSERVRHFPDNDRWELAAPLMESYPDAGPPWYGQAEQGIVWPERDRVDLLGPVKMHRPAGPDNLPMQIDTADVRAYPSRDYAETDAPTRVRQNQSWLRGTGARAWLAEDRVEFLSNVKGRYVSEDQ